MSNPLANILGEDPNIRKNKNEDDHTRVRANKFKAQAAAGVRPEIEAVDELPDYVDSISKSVDDNLFEPYFAKHSGAFERNLYENMTDLRSIRKIDNNLRFPKVAAIVGCAFSGGLFLRSCAGGSPAYAILYGVMSADLLRISYNCYIKNYCAIALKKLGSDGNPAKIGAAVFQWAQSAMGVQNAEDPFAKLRKDIMWDVVIDNTISSHLFKKVRAAVMSA